jgi:hypothetical protein
MFMAEEWKRESDAMSSGIQRICQMQSEFVKKTAELSEAQKSVLDCYAQQTSALIDFFRSVFPMMPPALFDISKSYVSEIARTQMRMLDLFTKQSKTIANEVEETIKRVA